MSCFPCINHFPKRVCFVIFVAVLCCRHSCIWPGVYIETKPNNCVFINWSHRNVSVKSKSLDIVCFKSKLSAQLSKVSPIWRTHTSFHEIGKLICYFLFFSFLFEIDFEIVSLASNKMHMTSVFFFFDVSQHPTFAHTDTHT